MPFVFLKIWAFVKKYWSYVALAIGGVVAFFMLRGNQVSLADQLKKVQDSHDTEIKKIEDAQAEERKQHEQNVKQLQDTLASVQKQYDEQKKMLDASKKAEISQIMDQYKDDPVALANKLSEATGFTVILPK